MATLNVGMLNRIAPVSFWKDREGVTRKVFFDFLEKENVDILALQEVWTESMGKVLQDIHPDYEVVLLPQRPWLPVLGHATGLGFLVRKNLLVRSEYFSYSSSSTWICLWGLLCDRGVLNLEINKSNQRFQFWTTHLTPMYSLVSSRRKQLEEIQKKMLEQYSKDKNLRIVLLGDFNMSKDWGPLREGEGTIDEWRANSVLYDEFKKSWDQNPFKCTDTWSEFKSAYRFTQDREQNLTAKDCPSSGKAPSQRDDMIWLCEGKQKLSKIIEHRLVFTDVVTANQIQFHFSDHFGVLSSFHFFD